MSNDDQARIKALIEQKIKEGKTKHQAQNEAVKEVRQKGDSKEDLA